MRISLQIMEGIGLVGSLRQKYLMGRYSVTVMSFGARFIAVCASPRPRWGHCSNVWESLMIVELSILVIAGGIQIPAYRLYTVCPDCWATKRKEKKGEVGSRCRSRNIAWHRRVPFGFARIGSKRKTEWAGSSCTGVHLSKATRCPRLYSTPHLI